MKRERVMGVRKSRRLIEAAQKLMDSITHRLPSDILMNILLRLPVADVMRCKCVCKEFLDLITTPEFVNSYLSQAVPGLLIFDRVLKIFHNKFHTNPYKIVEFVEKFDFNSDECRWGEVFNFNLPFDVPESVHSSVNGLLFFYRSSSTTNETFLSICNPITRDCINLPCPEQTKTSSSLPFKHETYGFGVSRISGQYKVVRMYMERKLNTERWTHDLFDCQVYTIGTGSWRRIASSSLVSYGNYSRGAVLNGNLHWMAFDLKSESACISCFDLETEVFTTFSTPPCVPFILDRDLSVMGNCLCLCDIGPEERMDQFVVHIWLMKEYGDHKSWTMELVIRKVYHVLIGESGLLPIKVFEDGDILMQGEFGILYYSNKTKNIREIDDLGLDCTEPMISAYIYAPSFVPLKTFATENVISF